MPEPSGNSLPQHPNAILFPRVLREGVFQQPQAITPTENCYSRTLVHRGPTPTLAKERGRERKSRIDTSGEPSIAGGRIGQGGGQLSRREVKLSCRPNQAVERREPPVLFAIFCTLGAGQAERTSRHFTGLRGAQ